MTTLTVRRLLVDLDSPFPVRWNGGDAFLSAWFNALSMSFPVGEQFFIDSVRDGVKQLPDAERQRFAAEVAGFIGQEATHRRVHGLFNAHLQRQTLDIFDACDLGRGPVAQVAVPRHVPTGFHGCWIAASRIAHWSAA